MKKYFWLFFGVITALDINLLSDIIGLHHQESPLPIKEKPMSFDFSLFRSASLKAMTSAMAVVKKYQGGFVADATIKPDQTLLTIADTESERTIILALAEYKLPDTFVLAEEGGQMGQGRFAILVDPLDGTRAFTNGLASSTVVVALYDTALGRVVSCVIGEPATDRIWLTDFDTPTFLSRVDSVGRSQSRVNVSNDLFEKQATVLLDVSHGFVRKGRTILTDEQTANLFGKIANKTAILMAGSNALHQALVANGGQKLVGSVTLAIGGPWDVAGVLLVLNAGGSAKAFSKTSAGLTEVNPLAIFDYDILVTANSEETVNQICNHLFSVA